jgi:hypothetical protein
MAGERVLTVYGRSNSITGARKGHEERITLRVHFMAVPLVESGTQELTALRQEIGVALTQLLEEVR